jgi:hypothetical protein
VNLHPKVAASAWAALAVAVLAFVGELAKAYPDSTWARGALVVVGLVTPLVAGYARSSGDWSNEPVPPVSVVTPDGKDTKPVAS